MGGQGGGPKGVWATPSSSLLGSPPTQASSSQGSAWTLGGHTFLVPADLRVHLSLCGHTVLWLRPQWVHRPERGTGSPKCGAQLSSFTWSVETLTVVEWTPDHLWAKGGDSLSTCSSLLPLESQSG